MKLNPNPDLDLLSDETIRHEHDELSRPEVDGTARWLLDHDYERWQSLDMEMIRRGLQRPVNYPRLAVNGIDHEGHPVEAVHGARAERHGQGPHSTGMTGRC